MTTGLTRGRPLETRPAFHGDILRQSRIRKGQSQRAVASYLEAHLSLKIHPSTVGAWERGTSRPPRDVVRALAAMLRVPMKALRG